MRKTKIVCTMGPSTASVEKLRELIRAGMDVARLNFSHGTHEDHGAMISRIREAAHLENKIVGIMLDIKGPKIRTGMIENDGVEVVDGASIILTTDEVLGTKDKVSISYEGLPEDVHPGSSIRIDDGLIGLRVEKVVGHDIHCTVTNGGMLKNRKGINAPGVTLRLPGVTEKDVADIRFGIAQGVDFIAASFVRKAADILEIRRILEEEDAKINIIAKIETQEGLDRIEEILAVTDGLMVARGDLGVEIPTEEVPIVQKLLINKCNQAGKPVITATQMLDSMQRNPRPTRAEATDVANAIFDGTDAIMLSGETAAGKYPVEAVSTMSQIAMRAESAILNREVPGRHANVVERTQTDAISDAVRNIAEELDAKAIITSTESGFTAKMVSKHRPKCVVIAVTPNERVARQLSLSWGTYSALVKSTKTTDEMLSTAVDGALSTGLVKSGDLVVITAGVPVGETGTTNMLKIHTIGDVIARGIGIGGKSVVGKAIVSTNTEDILSRVQPGDVLVTSMTDKYVMAAFEKASAVVTEEGGLTSHAAVVGLSLGIPVVVGASGILKQLTDGEEITVDAERGFIYRGRTQVL